MHVICDWIGNSREIATEHYLRTTEADFQKALGARDQQASEMTEINQNAANDSESKNENTPMKSEFLGEFEIRKLDDTRLELVTSTMSTWRSNQLS